MADDIEAPDIVDNPEIDAGRALGVSGRGNGTPRGNDVSPNTGILTPIDPSKKMAKVPTPIAVTRPNQAEVLDPSSIATTGRLRRTAPGDYDNTAARERWQKQHPFTSEMQRPEHLDPKFDAPTDRQIAEQRHAEVEGRRRMAEEAKAERDALTQRTNVENSSREADYRGSGKQFYTDPDSKLLTPIVDAETGRELYHETGWVRGERPDTKEPALVKRNKFGEKEYKRPPIVRNPDLTDDQLYYDMGDSQVPAGKIDDLVNHPDFSIAKQARTARRLRTTEMWKEASAGAQEEADAAVVNLKAAQERELGLQGEMETLSTQLNSLDANPAIKQTEGGFLGIGSHPGSAAAPLLAMKQQIQARMDQLGTEQAELQNQISPRGQLAREARMKTLSVSIMRAKARHVEYSQLADDRRAILRAQGKPEDGDETLNSILHAQAVYGGAVQKHTAGFQQEMRGQSSTVARPAGANIEAPDQFETPLPPQDEEQFQQWKQEHAPNDSGADYDLRGAFKAGLTPDANGHWPDTFKKPNHPTFSTQSVYAKDAPDKAGTWNGDTFVPPAAAEGKLKKTAKSFARGATSEGIYSAIEGISRLVSSSPILGAMDKLDDWIDEKQHGKPSEFVVNNRKFLREKFKDDFGISKVDKIVSEYADATKQLRQQIRDALPVDEKFAKSKLGQISQGVGQLAGNLPVAFATGGAGVAATSIGQIYDEGYQDAKQNGADDETAHRTAMKYMPAAALDFLADKLVIGKS
jgi:hypothetical protein